MGLLASELLRIKHELGFNLMLVGAEPWIGVHAVFDQVIQPYLSAGASTTSTTAVVAASTPTPVTITLADATGFATGQRVSVDVDARAETATIQHATGLTITVMLSKVHSGTYPVTVEGGESIIREILAKIRDVKEKLAEQGGHGALKAVDEIEFYQSGSLTGFEILGGQLAFWRGELASALGISANPRTQGCGGRLAVY